MVDNRGRMRFDTVSGFFIMIGIYKITSPSGKVYIGQSKDCLNRWNKYYLKLDCKGQVLLYRSLKKYGVENHKFEVIATCSEDELDELERYYQELYNVINPNIGLNCCLVKAGTRSKLYNKETREKIRLANIGKTHTEETKQKLREINLGKKLSEETKKKISEGNKGKVQAEETKLKLSELRKGKNNPMYGKKMSEGAKNKRAKSYDVTKNYNYQPILNTQTGIFYDTLEEASFSVGMTKKNLFNKLSGVQRNYTYLIRV